MEILGIAGSLRRESFNRKLLEAARYELPDGLAWRTWDQLAEVPPFDEEAEQGPVPPSVAGLRAAIAAADRVLIATPEYNGSVPGQLKNAIDWASRPYGESVLKGKRIAVIGTSPNSYGAVRAQADLRRVLSVAGADVVDAELPVPDAPRQFDEHGRLLDYELRAGLRKLLDLLAGTR
ncbi:NAD(P)H-dependent oxidoreductase [Amycolatopsis cynarae]|uniref:NAD(P)H-dependent oxidoreductase n=1 Tax=Amycolatopsis cynarae TaxID=2995223 RepID=A0ABY7B2Q2_9PSEU|nr:NADPH-dependent FMN reductase [Amycolatopsis sp. HUAS 11-8]WAL66580.1 NAD(P)H-dependent oxidoreductase [Amycolatopsis sp. HUAS 11-8]